MANQNGDILLTIKSMFKDEGFLKAEAAIKNTSKNAKTATDAILKVTGALGGMNNEAGKAASKIGGLFASFAQGGFIGLAISGITGLFTIMSNKIEEAKNKSEEASKKIRENFEKSLTNIKVGFQHDKANRDSLNNIIDALINLKLSENGKAEITKIKEAGKLRRTGMIDQDSKTRDLLEENVKVAALEYNDVSKQVYSNLNKAKIEYYKNTLNVDSAKVEQLKTLQKYDDEIDRLKKQLDAKYEAPKDNAVVGALGANIGLYATQTRGEYIIQDNKERLKIANKLQETLLARNNYFRESEAKRDNALSEFINSKSKLIEANKQGSIFGYNFDFDTGKIGFTDVKDKRVETAVLELKEFDNKRSGDFKNFLEQLKFSMEQELEARKEQYDYILRQNEEEKKKKELSKEIENEMERNKDILELYNRALNDKKFGLNHLASIQESINRPMIDYIRNGGNVVDFISNEDMQSKETVNNINKARKNLLGKIDNARRLGRDDDLLKWQNQLDRLNGKNDFAKKAEELQKARDQALKDSTKYLKEIRDAMQNVGL